MYLKVILILVSIFIFQTAYGQAETNPDFLRSVGKIYVVAAVTLVILLTLFIYMIIIDRKISRLEKRQKNE
jgi:heme/copper-type cytochrome/quinol oxidase subunit 2